jgi:hypothetical protein
MVYARGLSPAYAPLAFAFDPYPAYAPDRFLSIYKEQYVAIRIQVLAFFILIQFSFS